MKSDRFIIQTISVVICLFLIVYVSFHSVNLDSQPYQTEVALTYTISDSVEASGVIIREEQLISGQASGGVVSYQQSDGTVVREGSVIAEVYSSSSDISIRRQIRSLEEQITALQKVSDARSAEYSSTETVNRQINSEIDDYIALVHQGQISGISENKNELLYLLSQKDVIMGETESYESRITQLQSEVDSLTSRLSGSLVQYTSPDGETSILPWCMLSDGRMIYLANKVGKYELVYNAKSFTDVDGHWALEFIDFVTARELFNGTAEELFSAEMSMTRGMFVTVLGRLEGMDPQRYTAQSFEDVASGVWYAPYVEWAIRNGVISGYGNGKFGPNDPITREQMAVILYNYAGSIDQNVGTVGDLSGFSDQEQVSGWARTQMAWAVGCGLINGKSGGALDPAGRATRSEVAAILERFVGCVLTGYTDSDGGRS